MADLLQGSEWPHLLAIKSVHVDTTGDVNTLGVNSDVLQRALNAIEDTTHDTGAKLNGKGLSSAQHRISNADPGCFLVHLSLVSIPEPPSIEIEPG